MTIGKRFFWITLGSIITAVGLYFLLIPVNLAVGGVYSIGMILNYFFDNLPVGGIMLATNVILFILGFLLIGKEFGVLTIYSSLMISGGIWILEKCIPMNAPFVDDIFINLIFGILIQGIGIGIVFHCGASTGGTDIIAKIFNKLFNMNIGLALFLADFIIVGVSAYCFGLYAGSYAFLGTIINAVVIDNVIENLNSKIQLVIISDKYSEINNYIIHVIERGTTIYKADGGFSGGEKNIINTIVSRKEYFKIRDKAHEIDDKVFIAVGRLREVYGEGFLV